MAQSLSTGNLEILGYIFVIASTVKIGIYQYRSWWQWGREYKPTKVMNFRDGRLSSSETMCRAIGILLVIFLDDSSIFNWILEKVILYSVFSLFPGKAVRNTSPWDIRFSETANGTCTVFSHHDPQVFTYIVTER